MKIHQSNYKVVGFTESTDITELSSLELPLVADIGSGLLDENCFWLESGPPKWLAGEPGARQTLSEGADLVTFSTDKLLGGPQAGIIAIGDILDDVNIINGEFKACKTMSYVLSVDHRIVDGAIASKLLKYFKFFINNPSAMLI